MEVKKISPGKFALVTSEEEKAQQKYKGFLSRAVDTEGYSQKDIMTIVRIYQELASGDIKGPISIRKMKSFLEGIVKPADPENFSKLWKFYSNEENIPPNKRHRLHIAVEAFLGRFRTVENAYLYCPSFKETADRIASKLDAPEEMSTIERVKWLRIWMIILRDQAFFWEDFDKKNHLRGKEVSSSFDEYYIYPEIMATLEERYISPLEDGEIILELIQRMLNLYDKSIQKAVLRFGELDVNVPDCMKIGIIRNDIKKQLFRIPWVMGSVYFCTTLGIKSMDPANLKKAVEAYKNGGIDVMPTFEIPYIDIYSGFKKRNMTCYKYNDLEMRGTSLEVGVSGKEELEMYVELYKWLLEHPDFRFGKEKKTIKEYGMEDLLKEEASFEEARDAWIMEMGYAIDEADINYHLAGIVINRETSEKMFIGYYNGEIAGDEVWNQIGFASDVQSRLCFSHSGKMTREEANKMGAALKRVKMFGEEKALRSDIIYLEIFKYMYQNRREKLPNNLANTYGAKFA